MDKRVIFAVAGSGKTTYIIDSLSRDKRSLIVTYTVGNYNNLCNKISVKFNGVWPENIYVMSYFTFLYRFCYKPFLSDMVKARGIFYERNPNNRLKQCERSYYISPTGYIYSNRLALLIDRSGVMEELKLRLEKYFDELIIDEIQDIAGRDFSFLEQLMTANMNMLFVGDFYQHTYDTSRDGNTNKNLFDKFESYESRFTSKGFLSDKSSLVKSWRCSPSICGFITKNLGIEIYSNQSAVVGGGASDIIFVSDHSQIDAILADPNIAKLHYQNSSRYGGGHRNWGDTKGEDHYHDICVMLNKNTASKYATGKLRELPPLTRNKLYVAITRAHGKVYLINE
ncbi:MAG: UvrD-helicase domain-containing protein [Dysosmobacter sp.]|uniref:UvrD-helicase domain-containing protein n=1 Tax=Dysosmobacter sp. TaxID=2591382 RepID=UPI0026735EDC|nr:UvrD-helicase domain-containing protein [Dysosmobacter sp.]MCI6016565.1 UvrD-helicase domain-containing protein [Dysosmobacter sp.]